MTALTDTEFYVLVEYMHDYFGLNLKEKRHLIENRLNSLLLKRGLSSFSALYQILIKDANSELVSEVADRLSTNHTYFMRESRHFDFFREQVLPELKARAKNRDLRIWSAGCSSGQEAYTLAMIISDFFAGQKGAWDTRILATDISSRSLAQAREAWYGTEDLDRLPAAWRKVYFTRPEQGKSRVLDSLKNEVIFRRFNLLEEHFPFAQKFQVIFCRNVMIYFDTETKRQLVKRFYEHTAPGGYLFIGQSESLNWENIGYQYVIPSVYRRD